MGDTHCVNVHASIGTYTKVHTRTRGKYRYIFILVESPLSPPPTHTTETETHTETSTPILLAFGASSTGRGLKLFMADIQNSGLNIYVHVSPAEKANDSVTNYKTIWGHGQQRKTNLVQKWDERRVQNLYWRVFLVQIRMD